MACPVCFFRDSYQKNLKKNTHKEPRFEKHLLQYKDKFIDEIVKMDSLSNCECSQLYSYSEMIKWTDEFRQNIVYNLKFIEETFSWYSTIYNSFICDNPRTASETLWHILTITKLLENKEHINNYNKIFFRGRLKGKFDIADIKEHFHIPFELRHMIGNERFSVSGKPMLYLGNSIFCVEKELAKACDEISIAAFLPSFEAFKNDKVFSLSNEINQVIENSLPGICASGCKIDYNNFSNHPNRTTIESDLGKFILMSVCTFPIAQKGSFIPEYVISQLLTHSLWDHKYSGIIFPSTKDYDNISGNHRFSSFNTNLGIFVPYKDTDAINDDLLSKFYTVCLDGNEKYDYSPSIVCEKIGNMHQLINQTNQYVKEFQMPLINMKLHIDYIKCSKIDNKPYYDTYLGKRELELFMKMLFIIENRFLTL